MIEQKPTTLTWNLSFKVNDRVYTFGILAKTENEAREILRDDLQEIVDMDVNK